MKPSQIDLLRSAAVAAVQARDASAAVRKRGPEILPSVMSEMGVTQRELARRLGVDHTYLSRVANGHGPFPLELAERVYRLVCGEGSNP
jgi:plasmid maintenance system antidote protein VapI